MQVFVPYKEPFLTAACLDPKRLNKQILDFYQILDALDGFSDAWKNHPVVKMYKPHRTWLIYYASCLALYRNSKKTGEDASRFLSQAKSYSFKANLIRPAFLTDEFCGQHKRRLYTKNPSYYVNFSEFGKSDENWYAVDGQIVKYINGKRVK